MKYKYSKGPLIKMFRKTRRIRWLYHFNLSLKENKKKTSVFIDLFLLRRYVKGVTFLDGRYAKVHVVLFLSKIVYKMEKGLDEVKGAFPYVPWVQTLHDLNQNVKKVLK